MNGNWFRALTVFLAVGALVNGCSTPPSSQSPAIPQLSMNPMPSVAGYLPPNAIDVKAVLADPPTDDSATTRAELDRLLAIQAKRTPEDVARIQGEGPFSAYLFASALGASVKAEALPATDALLKRVSADAAAVISQAKTQWNRRRPWTVDTHIQPCIDKPTDSSYPSSRTVRSAVWAGVLCELFPAKKDALQAKADVVGQNRIDSGVHYPADVEAGKTLGRAIVAKLLAAPAFQSDLAAAKAEVAKVMAP